MDLAPLVPKHQGDTEAARRAAAAGYPIIAPILGELLKWTRDMNWPVAPEVERVLRKVGAPLSRHVLDVPPR